MIQSCEGRCYSVKKSLLDTKLLHVTFTEKGKDPDVPLNRIRTVAPEFSWIDLTEAPCFPIIVIACVDETSNLIEHTVDGMSSSDISLTSLKILKVASIAGDNAASGSSLADINTYEWGANHTSYQEKRNKS